MQKLMGIVLLIEDGRVAITVIVYADGMFSLWDGKIDVAVCMDVEDLGELNVVWRVFLFEGP